MRTVSIADALTLALDHQDKSAAIRTDPKAFFVHVKLPQSAIGELKAVQRSVLLDRSQHTDIDHITLVYTKQPDGPHAHDAVQKAVNGLRDIGAKADPIKARVQGWGYFDKVSRNGKPATALVALIDAPGLVPLHVDMSRHLEGSGIEPSHNRVFTPHVTLGYLDHHDRVDSSLPAPHTSFTIDKVHVASRDHHEIPLGGSSTGQKAAMEFMPKKELERGRADETREHRLNPELTEKIVRDHLVKDPGYYNKSSSLGVKAAMYAIAPDINRYKIAANWGSAGAIAKGVGKDALKGALPGAIVGGLYNAAFGDKNENPDGVSRFLRGGLKGGLAGGVIGAGYGSLNRYSRSHSEGMKRYLEDARNKNKAVVHTDPTSGAKHLVHLAPAGSPAGSNQIGNYMVHAVNPTDTMGMFDMRYGDKALPKPLMERLERGADQFGTTLYK